MVSVSVALVGEQLSSPATVPVWPAAAAAAAAAADADGW